MKKILAMLLCVIMVFSMVAMVSADEVTAAQVNDAAELAAGDQIVLVNIAGTHAMGAQDAKKRVVVSVAAADGVVALAEGVVVVTLEAGASDGTFALKVSDGYLYYDSGVGGNSIHTKADKDVAASWVITIADGIATIMNAADNARFLQYNFNTNQERFVCYKGTQENVVIYKLSGSAPVAPPAVEPTESAELIWDMSKAEDSSQWYSVQNKTVVDSSTATVTEAGTTISYTSNNAWKGIRRDNAQLEIAKLEGKLSFTYSTTLNVTHYRVYVLTDKGGDLAYNDEPTSGYTPANYYVAIKVGDVAASDVWTAVTNEDGSVTVTFDLNALPFYKEGTELKGLTIVTVTSKEIGEITYKNISLAAKQEEPAEPTEPAVSIVPVEDGQYILSWGDLTFAALAEDKTYGYCPAGSAAAPVETDIVTITNTADGKFTIQDSYGRYVYMKGNYNSFNVGAEAIESYEWILEDAGEGKVYLKNVGKEKYVSYTEQYFTWGSYADKAESGLLVIASAAAEPEQPTEPSVAPTEPAVAPTEPSGEPNVPTGDAIGAIVALLAISGVAVVALKKKRN